MSVPQLPETLERTWALAGVTYLAVNSSDTGPLGCVSPRPSLTGLPGKEEVETDPSQTVTTRVVRAIGERSLRGSEFPEETPDPVKDTRRMDSLVKRLSKGKRLSGFSRQAAHV